MVGVQTQEAGYTGPTIPPVSIQEPVMTIHSRTGTESNRRDTDFKVESKHQTRACKSNSGQAGSRFHTSYWKAIVKQAS